MPYDRVSRRFFLRGAGDLTLALPFLGSLAPLAIGEVAAPTLDNVVFLHIDHAWGYDNVKPAPGLTYEDLGQGMRRAPLPADFTQWGASYAKANAKLVALRDQICHIMGLDYTGSRADHWNACLLSGPARAFNATDTAHPDELTWETIDQLLGRKIYKKRNANSVIDTAVVGNSNFGSIASILNTDGSANVPLETHFKGNLANAAHRTAYDLYHTLFGGTTLTDAARKAIDYRDTNMLNGVYSDYKTLLANPRLSALDRQNVQNYVALISDFERRLTFQKTLGRIDPGVTVASTLSDYYSPDAALVDLVPILATALAAGATKVVTQFLYSEHVQAIDAAVDTLNKAMPNPNDYHHGIIHCLGGSAKGTTSLPTPYTEALSLAAGVDAYFLGFVADLATKLQSFVDQSTGLSLLDRTALVLGREHGSAGPQQDVHMLRDIHVLVVGGTKVFNGGYFYDYKTSTAAAANYGGASDRKFLGLPYNDFLYAMMTAMGLSPSDWELGGQPGYGYTATQAANGASYYVRDMRSPPPKLLKAG